MPWACPICNRTFKNRNQWHSCLVTRPEDHFKDKPLHMELLFNYLLEEVKKLGPVKVHAVKNAILVSADSNFLAVKPKKQWLDIEFILDHPVDEFPIFKTVRVSKKRFAHFLRIERQEEVNTQLVSWLKESFNTLTNA